MAQRKRRTLSELIEDRKTVLGRSDRECAGDLCVAQGTFTRWRQGLLFPNGTARLSSVAEWLGADVETVVLSVHHGRQNRPESGRAALAAKLAAIDEVLRRVADLEAEVAKLRALLPLTFADNVRPNGTNGRP